MNPLVVVALAPDAPVPDELARLEQVACPLYVRTAEEFLAARQSSEVMFVWDLKSRLLRDHGPGGIRWVQTNSIGVNAVATPEVVSHGVVVSNTRGLFERPIAEFVLTSVLMQARGTRQLIADQERERWQQRPAGLLQDRRALVVGAGGVGRCTVELLRATGIRAELMGRTPRRDPELGAIRGFGELHDMLPEVDDLVLAAPLTDDTRNMIGAPELTAMSPGAHLVNVGRGGLVDENALVAALQDGIIAAATLDVFEHEPLPPGHPFWSMKQVLVSPHSSANFGGWRAKAVELFVENLARWERGESLQNVVDLDGLVVSAPIP